MNIEELDAYISTKIQGVFGKGEMRVLKEEIEKLKPGNVYVEIGTDEGRSARVAHEYADPGVYKLWIDIQDPDPVPGITIGRGKFMQDEGMVGIGKKGFYIHGDANEFSKVFEFMRSDKNEGKWFKFVNLLFIDAFHDYDSVKENTLKWEPFLQDNGVILFHDYDHPGVKQWLDEHYGDKKEVFSGKVVKVQK